MKDKIQGRQITRLLFIVLIKVCLLGVPFSVYSQNIDTNFVQPPDTVRADSMQSDSLANINKAGRSAKIEGSNRDTTILIKKLFDGKKSSEMKIEAEAADNSKKKKKNKANNDTIDYADTASAKPHSATKATYLSMACPGLGQIYNKKYWKLPIIYGGFAGCAYAISFNNKRYKEYRTAYIYKVDGDSTTNNKMSLRFEADQLQSAKNFYRKNLELSYIITGLLYILNVVDAAVDAHLYDFSVSDDLSMRLEPLIEPSFNAYGRLRKPNPALKLTIKF